MTRATLKAAYRRFATHQQVTPEELGHSLSDVVRVAHRMSAVSWLNHTARDRRAAAAKPAGWERTALLNAARSCLEYARRMNADA